MRENIDKNFQALTRELRALMDEDANEARELLPLYRRMNSARRGRQGRFRKGPLALYWLSLVLGGDQRARHYLKREVGASPAPLVRRRPPRATRKLEGFLDNLLRDDEDLFLALFSVPGSDSPDHIARVLSRYNKNQLAQGVLADPGYEERQRWEKLADGLEVKRRRIRGIPAQEAEGMFSAMIDMGPARMGEIETQWREVRKDDRLTFRAYGFIRARMKTGADWIKIRELQRRFNRTKAELAPALGRLADHRLILWDKKARAVQINSYDPRDRRRFRWLAASSWPRSPFEPYLEKGKIYRVRDFRAHVVAEWVRTSAAEFIEASAGPIHIGSMPAGGPL